MINLTWQQKLRALQILSKEEHKGLDALYGSQSIPGNWYLSTNLGLGGDGFVRSMSAQGLTQSYAVEDLWAQFQRAFARGYYAVVGERCYQWKEFMWVEVPKRDDLPIYKDDGR